MLFRGISYLRATCEAQASAKKTILTPFSILSSFRAPKLPVKMLLVVLFSIAIGVGSSLEAQTGGRKRERKPKKHGSIVLRQYKSRGHADEFAKGNVGRRGFFSRLFRRDRPAWRYRKSGSARSNYKENRFLFKGHRTEGKHDNVSRLERQNKERARNRRHGNDTFSSKKHKRKK